MLFLVVCCCCSVATMNDCVKHFLKSAGTKKTKIPAVSEMSVLTVPVEADVECTLCFKKTGTLFVFAITLLVVIRF